MTFEHGDWVDGVVEVGHEGLDGTPTDVQPGVTKGTAIDRLTGFVGVVGNGSYDGGWTTTRETSLVHGRYGPHVVTRRGGWK